jgi:hypothetical protein
MERDKFMDEKQYMSGSQLRQYLHISTRKMKFLMDRKLIPHINTGHATHRYLVLKEDAEKFLVRMGTDPKLIAKLKGKFPHEGERHPVQFFVASEENCTAFREWLEKRWADLPDALPALTACEVSGYAHQRIRELVKENVLHGAMVCGTQYISKSEFISYLSSPEKLAKPRTETYKELIREFKKRQYRERENELRRQNEKRQRN